MPQNILHFFFRSHCLSCGKTLDGSNILICGRCVSHLKSIQEQSEGICPKCCGRLYNSAAKDCFQCSYYNFDFEKNTSIYYYKEPVLKELMHLFKFESNRRAGERLASLLKEKITAFLNTNAFDIIISTPVSSESFRKRGYNQVEFILEKCGIPFLSILKRKTGSPHQMELSAQERRVTIRGQYVMNKNAVQCIENKSILLIDDIFTTGSTLNEISGLLKRNKASSVSALTFFRD
jgi:competence protein ComFC